MSIVLFFVDKRLIWPYLVFTGLVRVFIFCEINVAIKLFFLKQGIIVYLTYLEEKVLFK